MITLNYVGGMAHFFSLTFDVFLGHVTLFLLHYDYIMYLYYNVYVTKA